MRKALCLLSLMMSCFVNSGCITVGPKVETRIVIARPGKPFLATENKRIKGKTLDGNEDIEQDVGGKVFMDQEHFEAMKRAIEKK